MRNETCSGVNPLRFRKRNRSRDILGSLYAKCAGSSAIKLVLIRVLLSVVRPQDPTNEPRTYTPTSASRATIVVGLLVRESRASIARGRIAVPTKWKSI